MSTYEELVIEASKTLKDYDGCDGQNFVRWGKEDLLHYAKDALSNLYTLYPKKFTTVQEIELAPGKIQKLPDGLTLLSKVLGAHTNGDAIASIASPTHTRLADVFSHECGKTNQYSTAAKDYTLNGYELETSADNIFYVSPPVPKTEDPVMVTVLCSKVPSTDFSFTDIVPSWAHSLLLEWMLYRAFIVDSESQTDVANAELHHKNFFSLLSGILQSEAMLLNSNMKAVTSAAN